MRTFDASCVAAPEDALHIWTIEGSRLASIELRVKDGKEERNDYVVLAEEDVRRLFNWLGARLHE